MKIEIDENGVLKLERAGKMKHVYCPYVQPTQDTACGCGDWCALFSEPTPKDTYIVIELCMRTWKTYSQYFSDFRNKEEMNEISTM